MANEINLKEYKRAYRQLISEEEKKSFVIHLVVYILVNTMLIIINLLYSPEALWFFFPLLGWGIGLASHYLSSMLWLDRELERKEAEAEYRVRQSRRK